MIDFPSNPNLDDLFTDASSIEWQCIDATVGDVQWARTGDNANFLTEDLLLNGVNYTAGVSNSVTITIADPTSTQLWVFFDGVMQHSDQFSVSGQVITFNEIIPGGIASILVKNAKRVQLPAVELTVSRKNYIINPTYNINQRGFAGGVEVKSFTFDRWRLGSSMTVTLPDADGFVTIVGDTNGSFQQRIEIDTVPVGTVMTVSWDGSSQASEFNSEGQSWKNFRSSPFTFTTKLGFADTLAIIGFTAGTLKNLKVEVGSVATPFEYPDIATELNKCRRYFQRYTSPHMNGSGGSGTGVVNRIGFCLDTQMRRVPDVTISGVVSFFDGSNAGSLTGTPTFYTNINLFQMDCVSTFNHAATSAITAYNDDAWTLFLDAEF